MLATAARELVNARIEAVRGLWLAGPGVGRLTRPQDSLAAHFQALTDHPEMGSPHAQVLVIAVGGCARAQANTRRAGRSQLVLSELHRAMKKLFHL